ncbi:hypothetical protein PTSG_00524 [Salpingoeca rosetta]|uniref:Methyltransferase small domain-containing protein n=1 Tax=Salpingoeca rosetta (strain ATCC 50818 / BSB-021) TaxID=946362 RepID=F2TWQ1_SALR5|nr:uncharacterized protein PTSG_00524 [Salpingoeca rosetta]EGD72497.1 hypothetical protein PTSG_00524 [Salpingoeca rosetta]|eukprot:XP_004999066.1 hypothetical protein PTSG_00524 [Salpingoeca rosetta]
MELHVPEYGKVDSVYEPAEDTFLLIDGLEADLKNILAIKPQLCVEIGSGSGVPITSLACFLKDSSKYMQVVVCVAVDINPDAVMCTQDTFQRNGIEAECLQGDLLQPLIDRSIKADILIFNPPYVVTPSEEVGQEGLMAAWAGGADGREVIDRFLPQVPAVLTDSGILYMIALQENLIGGSLDSMLHMLPEFEGEIVLSRRAGGERLHVLKFVRRQ